jgi:uncharacterized repeat protein (TIGR04076 family)
MERRELLKTAACCLATLTTGTVVAQQMQPQAAPPKSAPPPPPKRRRYKIEIEIFEARTDSWCHKKGDKFTYPEEWGKLCPWLRGSLNDFVRILEHGGTLSWKYEGTPYEKVIDPDGVTTEYVRCPDPTSNLVAKITRTLLA